MRPILRVRLCTVLAVVLLSAAAASEPPWLHRPITDADVAGKSSTELRLMRNELFARHGHTFKSQDLREHFSRQPWYAPRMADASALLTPVQRANVKALQAAEDAAHRREQALPMVEDPERTFLYAIAGLFKPDASDVERVARQLFPELTTTPPDGGTSDEALIEMQLRQCDLVARVGKSVSTLPQHWVALACVGSHEVSDNGVETNRCEPTLVVLSRDGGQWHKLARQDVRDMGIEQRFVAGNNARVEVSCVPASVDGGALIQLTRVVSEGDESMQTWVTRRLFAVADQGLADVLAYEAEERVIEYPSRDESTVIDLKPERTATGGMLDLVAVRKTCRQRRCGEARSRYVWDGGRYVERRGGK